MDSNSMLMYAEVIEKLKQIMHRALQKYSLMLQDHANQMVITKEKRKIISFFLFNYT